MKTGERSYVVIILLTFLVIPVSLFYNHSSHPLTKPTRRITGHKIRNV